MNVARGRFVRFPTLGGKKSLRFSTGHGFLKWIFEEVHHISKIKRYNVIKEPRPLVYGPCLKVLVPVLDVNMHYEERISLVRSGTAKYGEFWFPPEGKGCIDR